MDTADNISPWCDRALFLISQQPPTSLYTLSPLPYIYLSHVSFPSISVHYLTMGRTSLHLVDMPSPSPGEGDVEMRLWDKVLVLTVVAFKSAYHIPTQHRFLHSLIIYWKCSKLSWHLESCRWKRFKIHCSENAMVMNHCWAHHTWLCSAVLVIGRG